MKIVNNHSKPRIVLSKTSYYQKEIKSYPLWKTPPILNRYSFTLNDNIYPSFNLYVPRIFALIHNSVLWLPFRTRLE